MSLEELLHLKYGDLTKGGWAPRLRASFGYATPDDRYEWLVSRYVTPETDWLEVGAGRTLWAGNVATARLLATTCRSLTGIDPSDNILEHDMLHSKEQCFLQDYHPDRQFDLVTMRMVVEHIEDPAGAASALGRLVRPGGRVIVYTVNKWSPISILSALTPMSVHLIAKRFLWAGEDKDTFPTVYKMNTRRALRDIFSNAGFSEEYFEYLDDTRTSARFRIANTMELTLWRICHAVRISYPENCLLGVYCRIDPASTDGTALGTPFLPNGAQES